MLKNDESRLVAYLEMLPYQEGTPLAPIAEEGDTELAESSTGSHSPDREVYVLIEEGAGGSGGRNPRNKIFSTGRLQRQVDCRRSRG